MKKEDFTALGISEELAVKAAEASKTELEEFISKTEYDLTKQAKEQLEKDIKERDKQLETLKKAGGDKEALQNQITELQAENKAAKEKYEADMKELKLSTAIKVAVAGSAHDTDIVAGLMDKSKLILSDDGKVSGLDEQLKTIKETKPFLFKEAAQDTGAGEKSSGAAPGGYKPRGGKTNDSGFGKGIAEALNKSNEAAENPFAKAWG